MSVLCFHRMSNGCSPQTPHRQLMMNAPRLTPHVHGASNLYSAGELYRRSGAAPPNVLQSSSMYAPPPGPHQLPPASNHSGYQLSPYASGYG